MLQTDFSHSESLCCSDASSQISAPSNVWFWYGLKLIFLYISVLRVASGPRVKLARCKSALNSTVVYSTDRSKAVVLVVFLLFVLFFSICVVMLA